MAYPMGKRYAGLGNTDCRNNCKSLRLPFTLYAIALFGAHEVAGVEAFKASRYCTANAAFSDLAKAILCADPESVIVLDL